MHTKKYLFIFLFITALAGNVKAVKPFKREVNEKQEAHRIASKLGDLFEILEPEQHAMLERLGQIKRFLKIAKNHKSHRTMLINFFKAMSRKKEEIAKKNQSLINKNNEFATSNLKLTHENRRLQHDNKRLNNPKQIKANEHQIKLNNMQIDFNNDQLTVNNSRKETYNRQLNSIESLLNSLFFEAACLNEIYERIQQIQPEEIIDICSISDEEAEASDEEIGDYDENYKEEDYIISEGSFDHTPRLTPPARPVLVDVDPLDEAVRQILNQRENDFQLTRPIHLGLNNRHLANNNNANLPEVTEEVTDNQNALEQDEHAADNEEPSANNDEDLEDFVIVSLPERDEPENNNQPIVNQQRATLWSAFKGSISFFQS